MGEQDILLAKPSGPSFALTELPRSSRKPCISILRRLSNSRSNCLIASNLRIRFEEMGPRYRPSSNGFRLRVDMTEKESNKFNESQKFQKRYKKALWAYFWTSFRKSKAVITARIANQSARVTCALGGLKTITSLNCH